MFFHVLLVLAALVSAHLLILSARRSTWLGRAALVVGLSLMVTTRPDLDAHREAIAAASLTPDVQRLWDWLAFTTTVGDGDLRSVGVLGHVFVWRG